ncbi:response regulator [Corallococcus llansteffanensis]|uniref:Response regulator n=1 Tax=Corallococcus llansteffanensis TaxID=2316731 RepID=A0A3A8Q4E2_9BACT|nr:response regulator [Corallococcus llansteffanensis]RKH61790.1 response regulator [Corallococcus llansteffanensis]
MTPPGNVLIVDDERAFFETYQEILVPEGYRVEWAPDRKTAQARLQESTWDVVVLDQRLQGAAGSDSGIDLIAEIVPTGAKVIVATAYADDKMIDRAFKDGAYDYLEKLPTLPMMLRIKVRNASEAVRERRLASLNDAQRELEIQGLWAACRIESNGNRKGRLLEDLMVLMFKTIQGMMNTSIRRTSADEEIDIVIRNESTDQFWVGERSPYIIVECKNWSKHVGPIELVVFRDKIVNRGGRCRLGFFVAAGGFTEGFQTRSDTFRKDDHLVVPIGPADLDELVLSKNRNETLKKLHERAVMGGHDSS